MANHLRPAHSNLQEIQWLSKRKVLVGADLPHVCLQAALCQGLHCGGGTEQKVSYFARLLVSSKRELEVILPNCTPCCSPPLGTQLVHGSHPPALCLSKES